MRFVEGLADIKGAPAVFIDTLRLERWLIHDWLDYSGRYLISRYKSHNREKSMPSTATEASRQLFVEVMLDYARANKGEKSKWTGRMSAAGITLELDRRKGKAGKKNTA